jgi:hypothetical protein
MQVTTVRLAPTARLRLVVAMTVAATAAMHIKLRKLDATLSIRLVEYARDAQVH